MKGNKHEGKALLNEKVLGKPMVREFEVHKKSFATFLVWIIIHPLPVTLTGGTLTILNGPV